MNMNSIANQINTINRIHSFDTENKTKDKDITSVAQQALTQDPDTRSTTPSPEQSTTTNPLSFTDEIKENPFDANEISRFEKESIKALNPLKNSFIEIELATIPLVEFQGSFKEYVLEGSIERIDSLLQKVKEIKSNQHFEQLDTAPLGLHYTSNHIERFMNLSKEELSIKNELNTIYTQILLAEPKPFTILKNLFVELENKIKETLQFYQKNKTNEDKNFKETIELYIDILLNVKEIVKNNPKPKNAREALIKYLNTTYENRNNEKASELLTELHNACSEYTNSKTVKSLSKIRTKRKKLILFYQVFGVENPHKDFTDMIQDKIINMPQAEFKLLKR